VTTTASRATFPADHESVPDAGRLEQVLRLHDALLLGDVAPTSIAARICQGVAILLHAATVRLALVEDERLEVVASYGAPECPPVDVAELRHAIIERRPAIVTIAHGRRTLTIPLQGGDVAVVLRTYAPDPYRPRIRVIMRSDRTRLERPYDLNLWEAREGQPTAVQAPLDPAEYQVDPLTFL